MNLTGWRDGVRAAPLPRSRLGTSARYVASEGRFLLVVILAVALVSSIPTAFGYASAPGNRWFSGIVYNVHDAAQYLSWMREADRGVFAENMLTSEPNGAVFFNLHWWVPGRVAALAGISLPLMYQLYRLAAIPLLLVALAVFCRLLFSDPARRRFCLLLTVGTSGMGWIWVVDKYLAGRPDIVFPLDVHGLSGNVFWTVVTSPHLVLALALLYLTLAAAHVGCWARKPWASLVAGALALLLGMGHIYDLVTVWAVLAAYGLVLVLQRGWSNRVFARLFTVVAVSAPSATYWGWVSSDANPVWKEALSQYDNLGSLTPSPLHLVVFLGLTFLAALPALFRRREPPPGGHIWTMIRCWFVVTPVLVYLPLPFQITLLAGYPLPMAALATVTLYDHVLPWWQGRRRGGGPAVSADRRVAWLPYLFLLLVIPTNLYLVAWRVVDLGRHDYPYYLHRGDVAAMVWLAANSRPQDVVLTSFPIGHYLPGLASNKAFLANAVMTTDFERKRELVDLFYDEGTDDGWRRAFLDEYGIRYVFHGPSERRLGGFDPAPSTLFERCVASERTAVYRVLP